MKRFLLSNARSHIHCMWIACFLWAVLWIMYCRPLRCGPHTTLLPPIDVLYTWVNGSDEIWQRAMQKHRKISLGNNVFSSNAGQSRYFDNDELKYSLRSLHQFAPWVRNIYILTTGQVPRWLDTSHPKIKIITHDEVFVNKSHLPTFSSPAIEANFHNIPYISELFLYLNDDFFLGGPVTREDFITPYGGYKIYIGQTEEREDPNYVHNVAGPRTIVLTGTYIEKDMYAKSLNFVDKLYTLKWGKVPRRVPPHMPILVNKTILRDLHSTFPQHFNTTSSNKFRRGTDMQFAFSYTHFIASSVYQPSFSELLTASDSNSDGALSSGEMDLLVSKILPLPIPGGIRSKFHSLLDRCSTKVISELLECSHLYKLLLEYPPSIRLPVYQHERVDVGNTVHFKQLKGNTTRVQNVLDEMRSDPRKFIAINDDLNHYGDRESLKLYAEFKKTMFPYPSPFEHASGEENDFSYLHRKTPSEEM